MGIFQLPYVRKINKLHFFTYQIITFVFPTLNARKLANLLYKKTPTFFSYLYAHIVKYNAHFFNKVPLGAISLGPLTSTGGAGVTAVTLSRVRTVCTAP